MTSINPSPMSAIPPKETEFKYNCKKKKMRINKICQPCKAKLRSTKLKLLLDNSLSDLLSCSLRKLNGAGRVRFLTEVSPHKLDPPWVYGMFSKAMPCSDGPLAKSSDTPSHWIQTIWIAISQRLARGTWFCPYHDVNVFVEILTRSGERLGRRKFKVPQFVFHAAVEFVRILFPLGMEFHANGRVLCQFDISYFHFGCNN